MGKKGAIALWVIVGLLALWLSILSAVALGEIAALNRLLAERPAPVAETGLVHQNSQNSGGPHLAAPPFLGSSRLPSGA